MARDTAIAAAAFTLAAFFCVAASGMAAEDIARPFASRGEAETYLEKALPAATAANPKYRSSQGDVLTRWLTKSIAFEDAPGGGVIVTTDETYDEYRGDAPPKPNTHQARFAIDDVTVAPESSNQDLTESGEEAKGVIFRCKGAPCIDAVWNGQSSKSGLTDIYIEDAAARQRVIAAFRALQRPGSG